MKILNFFGSILLSILVSIIGIVEIVGLSIIPIWKAKESGYVWFGVFYQPFVVLFSFIPIFSQIEHALISSDSRLFWIIIITFEILIFTFILNAVIELIFNLCNKETIFDNIQELQRYSNNYALIIISLLSLFVSAFPNTMHIDNLSLLIIGSVFFVSTISSDTYRVFIYSKGDVKELAKKVKYIFKES